MISIDVGRCKSVEMMNAMMMPVQAPVVQCVAEAAVWRLLDAAKRECDGIVGFVVRHVSS